MVLMGLKNPESSYNLAGLQKTQNPASVWVIFFGYLMYTPVIHLYSLQETKKTIKIKAADVKISWLLVLTMGHVSKKVENVYMHCSLFPCLDDVTSLSLTVANRLSTILEKLCLLKQGRDLVPYHSKDSLFHTKKQQNTQRNMSQLKVSDCWTRKTTKESRISFSTMLLHHAWDVDRKGGTSFGQQGSLWF